MHDQSESVIICDVYLIFVTSVEILQVQYIVFQCSPLSFDALGPSSHNLLHLLRIKLLSCGTNHALTASFSC